MPTFSLASMQKLATCDPRLQRLMDEVIEIIDITILVGHRGKAEQDEACSQGKSKTPWPTSKHNSLPSKAVDIVQYFPVAPHIRWNDERSFTLLAGIVKAVAANLGYKIRWGGDWDSDDDQSDEKGLRDLDHWEIVD